jgi:hypothetical protein
MSEPWDEDRIQSWVDEFLSSPRFLDHGALVREYAPEVLTSFLRSACAHRDIGPDEIEETDLKVALLEGVGRLDLPGSVRGGVVDLLAAFLEELQTGGRLSGGRMLGKYVRALREPFLDAASGRAKPFVRPAGKVGRNDPCPCGSGRKYKRCCQGRLGS